MNYKYFIGGNDDNEGSNLTIIIFVFIILLCLIGIIVYFFLNSNTNSNKFVEKDGILVTSEKYKYNYYIFTPTTIRNGPLPVDRLSIITRNAILSNSVSSLIPTSANTDRRVSGAKSAGVYGCKLLFSSYTGPVMTIQSSITNIPLANIYADSYGNISVYYLGEDKLTTNYFSSEANILYVQIWWDQTGNGNHAYQFDQNNQPIYDPENKYITFPDRRYFNLPNGAHPYNDSPYTYVFKCSIGNTIRGGVFGGGTQQGTNYINAFRRDNTTGYVNYWFGDDNESFNSYLDNSVISLVYNGTKMYIYQNRTSIKERDRSNRTQSASNNFIGKTGFDGFGSESMGGGYIEYMYIIPQAISDLDRNILESTYFTYKYNNSAKCDGCYSMRLAIPTYTGPIINVTIVSTNYEFYTDTMQTYFTTGPNNTGTSLSSIIGSSYIAYVNKWYNQAGGNNYLIQSGDPRPQIAMIDGKFVIHFVNENNNRHYFNFSNGIAPYTIFSHFKPIFNPNYDSLTVLVQTNYDFSLRFASTGMFNIDNAGWYASSSGTKNSYVNNKQSDLITFGSWNVFATSVENTTWKERPINTLAYDINFPGRGNRGLNGYMVEIIFNNEQMGVPDMQQFYNNRLF